MDPRGHNFHDLQPVISAMSVSDAANQYRDKLGFKIDFIHGEPAIYTRVSREKVMIHFSQSDEENPPGSVKWFYVGLGHVDGAEDMDMLFEEYSSKGIKITMPPTVQPYGLREFEIEEPTGVRIRFHVDSK